MPANINERYTFFVTDPDGNEWQAYPSNSTLKWKWEKDSRWNYFRKILDTDLVFVNDPTGQIKDFDKLLAVEKSNQRCNFILLNVKKTCSGSEPTIFWPGRMRCAAGEWNESYCRLKIKPEPLDAFTCLFDNWEEELDFATPLPSYILQVAPQYQIEIKQCSWVQEGTPSSAPGGALWEIFEHCPELDDNAGEAWTILSFNYFPENQFSNIINVESELIREVGFGTCSGGDPVPPDSDPAWILLTNNCPTESIWARPFTAFQDPNTNSFSLDFKVHNAYKLSEILQWYAGSFGANPEMNCTIPIRSNFFNINPDGSAPDNQAYQKAAQGLQDVHILHLSDFIKDDHVDGPNSIATIPYSLKSILENLPGNIGFTFDEGTLVIEHVSYFRREKMLDLTVDGFKEANAGNFKYTYDKTKLPNREDFFWRGETDKKGGDFDGYPITYSGACIDRESKPASIPFELFYSNLKFIYENKHLYSSDLDGLIILSVLDGKILFDRCPLSQQLKLNGHFAISTLQENYYKWDRPLPTGTMNKQPTNFFRWMRQKRQTNVKAELCCSDLDIFDPDDLVKTQPGWGEVDDAELEEPKSMLKLNLAFH